MMWNAFVRRDQQARKTHRSEFNTHAKPERNLSLLRGICTLCRYSKRPCRLVGSEWAGSGWEGGVAGGVALC